MPPPLPLDGSRLPIASPPVTVTPRIVTVGSLAAPATPIVSTGPPPLIVVELGPAPTILTLTSIVTPPAYVPGPSLIVSPACAAARAGASCVYGQPLSQTSGVAADACPAAS